MGDMSNALISFTKGSQSADNTDSSLMNQFDVWIHKTTLESGNPNVGNINSEIYIDNKVGPAQPTPVTTVEEVKVAEQPVSQDVKSIKELSHDMYQNDQFVFLSILKKKMKGEFRVVLSIDHCEVISPEGQRFSVQLANKILLDGSTWTQTDFKIELKLKKQESGIFWSTLNKEDVVEKPREVLPSYPTSNKNKKNWDVVNRECEKEMVKDKNEGDAAMNQLLQQIYAGADEDTKRAMIKSYQTSNGTVLSTSWDDVRTKDYEGKDYVAPPDHFEAKKPEI